MKIISLSASLSDAHRPASEPTITPAPTPAIVAERRDASRTRTVYRVARVRSETDQGLARVRNISDGGMRLAVGLSMNVGDIIEISMSEKLLFEGRVVWTADGECGVEFSDPVDSAEALRCTAEEIRSGKGRPLRLPIGNPVVVESERGMHVTRLHDISMRGMKIGHDGSFEPGLAVKVTLAPDIERRGIVRWVRGDFAGVVLIETFTLKELGSASAL